MPVRKVFPHVGLIIDLIKISELFTQILILL